MLLTIFVLSNSDHSLHNIQRLASGYVLCFFILQMFKRLIGDVTPMRLVMILIEKLPPLGTNLQHVIHASINNIQIIWLARGIISTGKCPDDEYDFNASLYL